MASNIHACMHACADEVSRQHLGIVLLLVKVELVPSPPLLLMISQSTSV